MTTPKKIKDKSQVKRVLKQALRKLGPRGKNWSKDQAELFAPVLKKHCVVTAIYASAPDILLADKATRAVRSVVGLRRGKLAAWNDSRPSFTPVKEALEKAIRAQGQD